MNERTWLFGFGCGCRGLAGRTLRFRDARLLAAQPAQVIELGAPHLAVADQLDRVDHRRVEREHALDALAVRDLAHGEVLVQPAAGAADTDAFIGLDAGALALDHLDVHQHGVARAEIRDVLAGRELLDLLLFELLDEVHGACLRRQRQHPARGTWLFLNGFRGLLDQRFGLVILWISGRFWRPGGPGRPPIGRAGARASAARPRRGAIA